MTFQHADNERKQIKSQATQNLTKQYELYNTAHTKSTEILCSKSKNLDDNLKQNMMLLQSQ